MLLWAHEWTWDSLQLQGRSLQRPRFSEVLLLEGFTQLLALIIILPCCLGVWANVGTLPGK
jgi:hypothetical protein